MGWVGWVRVGVEGGGLLACCTVRACRVSGLGRRVVPKPLGGSWRALPKTVGGSSPKALRTHI